jgi:hypothetical protein
MPQHKKKLPPLAEAKLRAGKLSEREVEILRKYGYNVDGEPDHPIPNLFVRGYNFTRALLRWGWGGGEHRTQEEIDAILQICEGCELLNTGVCTACGCNCNSKQTFLNKIYLKTEICPHPDGPKWK